MPAGDATVGESMTSESAASAPLGRWQMRQRHLLARRYASQRALRSA